MKILKVVFASLLVLGTTSLALAQNTVVTKNSDGTWTVVQYPTGKDVMVSLRPWDTNFKGTGMAHVVRTADGTKVVFDVNGVPTDATSYYAYAVDPTGTPTLLGPVTVTNGVAKAEFTTPMDRFMLVLSPNGTLTSLDRANVILGSDVPAGFTVIPRGAEVVATTTTTTTTTTGGTMMTTTNYDVPLLGISSFGADAKTLTTHFRNGELAGLDATAHIHRHDNMTTVRVKFNDLKKVSPTKHFMLWARTPDGTFTRLGDVYNWKHHDEATIKAETPLKDFGLLMTVEDTAVTVPTSTVWTVFRLQ
ncbi:MAG TPA: hypothetical protein VL501_03060 [Pyrinomonadaceae bacterium]|nr:hypothetical protein [Pyrinomonadaceae bacterium]